LDATAHLPPQHHQLIVGAAAFSASSRLFDLNGEGEQGQAEAEQRDHRR
jgi:hypothetical protein